MLYSCVVVDMLSSPSGREAAEQKSMLVQRRRLLSVLRGLLESATVADYSMTTMTMLGVSE